MKLNQKAFRSRIAKQLDNCYLFFGPEPFLLEEESKSLRETARDRGVDQIMRVTAGIDLDWNELYQSSRSTSLFATRRMIEISLPTGKPGLLGSKMLTSLVDDQRDDIIIVVLAGRIDRQGQTTSWFKALEKDGVVVEIPTISSQRLPDWIRGRLVEQGLQADLEIARRLTFFVEGNLRAAAQEIDKLALLLPRGKKVTNNMLDKCVSDQPNFNVYQFVDTCLGGVPVRASRILTILRRDGAEPALVIWALAREIRQVAAMANEIDDGYSKKSVLGRHQIWSSRVSCMNAALDRHSSNYWHLLLARLADLDQCAKGRHNAKGSIWDQIEDVAFSVCGINSTCEQFV